MSYLQEIKHTQKAPYDVWQIVRISSGTNKESVRLEIADMKKYLNEYFKDTSFKVDVGWDPDDMRRIYIQKLKKWKRSDSDRSTAA